MDDLAQPLGNQIALAVFSFGLGIVAKYADLVNEHGMQEHFRGAGWLSGFAWGAFGAGMVAVSPLGGLTYVAHVLYWFLRIKLEYFNHAVAGVIMVMAGFVLQGDLYHELRWDLLAVFMAYTVTGYLQSYFKSNYPNSQWFWRLRLRIYAVPIVYAIYRWNVDPIIATGFGMIACEIMTHRYRQYAD